MFKKVRKIATIAIAGVISAGLSVGMIACSPQNTEVPAATVNGVEIKEQTITDFVQNTRKAMDVSSDEDWASYLGQNSYTPSIIRDQAVDYYVRGEAMKLAADELGVTLDENLVNENFNSTKAGFASDQEWQDALEGAGLTEAAYRLSLEEQILRTQVSDKYNESNAPAIDDAALFEAISVYDGAKRSSHILIKTESVANEVLDKINSGELSFEDAVGQYSEDTGSAANGGDVGWDKLTSFVAEYNEGLAGLAKDEISGLVPSQFGFHIIKCTDVFEVPEGGLTSTEGVPAEILDRASEDARAAAGGQEFEAWFADFSNSLDVVVNPMPEGLPYDVEPVVPEPAAAPESAADATGEPAA